MSKTTRAQDCADVVIVAMPAGLLNKMSAEQRDSITEQLQLFSAIEGEMAKKLPANSTAIMPFRFIWVSPFNKLQMKNRLA